MLELNGSDKVLGFWVWGYISVWCGGGIVFCGVKLRFMVVYCVEIVVVMWEVGLVCLFFWFFKIEIKSIFNFMWYWKE